jgi:hypothetical protein
LDAEDAQCNSAQSPLPVFSGFVACEEQMACLSYCSQVTDRLLVTKLDAASVNQIARSWDLRVAIANNASKVPGVIAP